MVTQVALEELLDREDRTVFLRLSNALCMHASLELGLSMRQVAQEGRGDKIAYNVGGKMLTAAQLERVL
jgi:hypothetical protein